MSTSPWKRMSRWLATILLGVSLLPPVATADDGLEAAAKTEGITAQATAAAAPVLAAGPSHTLLIQPGGVVWAWGDSSHGQTGSGNWNDVEPTLVPLLPAGVKGISAGASHSLAVGPDGAVWAWGMNYYGQVGPDTSHDYNPYKLKMTGVTAVAAGAAQSLALKSGGVVGWGANDRGQLGNGTWTQALSPVSALGLSSKVTAIASGADHSLALKSDGSVWAWGANGEGAVGDGTQTDHNAPVKVAGLPSIVKIAAGGASSFALTADGTLWGWGRNQNGELGNGSFENQLTPMKLMTNVAQVAPGLSHTLVLKKDKTVLSMGSNETGQLGFPGPNVASPVELGDLTGASSLAAGAGFSLAVQANGRIYGWGSNSYGQLGIGESPEVIPDPTPALVGVAITNPAPFDGVIRVAATKATLNGLSYPQATVTAELAGGTTKSAVADATGKFALRDLIFPPGVETSVSLRATTATGAASSTHVMVAVVDDGPPKVAGIYLRLIDNEGNETTQELTQTGTTYSGTVTAAAETVLYLASDEPVSKITVSPAPKQIRNGVAEFSITLGDLKKGVNTVTVELTDMVGKKTRLTLQLNYEAGPVMTISTPRSNPVFGAPKNGVATIPVEFKGTADEKLATLLVVNADTGEEITQVDMTGAPSTSWKVTLEVDAVQASNYRYRFLGVDPAGYPSKPSATDADVRTVTVDPIAPDILFSSPADQLVFTDGDDKHLGVEKNKLIIAGEATDEHSGIKQVSAGTSKATPSSKSDPHRLDFRFAVSLKENALTTVPFSAEDAAGNKTEAFNLYAVLKTKISKVSASGTWYKQYEALKVTGATDAAFNIGSKDHPYWVGMVPWELWFKRTAATGAETTAESNLNGVPAGATRLQMSASDPSAKGGASAQASCYDIATGKFSCYFDTSGLDDGKYTFYVKALAPDEFPDLTELKSKTFTVTIRR